MKVVIIRVIIEEKKLILHWKWTGSVNLWH